MSVDPVRENPLVRSAKLPCSRQHPAAVDPDRKPKRLAVFECNGFGRELRAAVERDGRPGKEGGADSLFRNSRRQLLRVVQTKRVAINSEGKRRERGNRINPAAAEQNESSSMRSAVFEDVHETREIVLQELPAAEATLQPRQYARIGCCVDDPVGRRKRFEVAGRADVAMDKIHAKVTDPAAIGLRARTHHLATPPDQQTFPPS